MKPSSYPGGRSTLYGRLRSSFLAYWHTTEFGGAWIVYCVVTVAALAAQLVVFPALDLSRVVPSDLSVADQISIRLNATLHNTTLSDDIFAGTKVPRMVGALTLKNFLHLVYTILPLLVCLNIYLCRSVSPGYVQDLPTIIAREKRMKARREREKQKKAEKERLVLMQQPSLHEESKESTNSSTHATDDDQPLLSVVALDSNQRSEEEQRVVTIHHTPSDEKDQQTQHSVTLVQVAPHGNSNSTDEQPRKENSPTWCMRCESSRPPRSGHCTSCHTCVLAFDHHCGVIGACVGQYNYRFFVWFLLWASIALLGLLGLTLLWLFQIPFYSPEAWSEWEVYIAFAFMGGYLMVTGMPFMCFLIHSCLILQGLTLREKTGRQKIEGDMSLWNCCIRPWKEVWCEPLVWRDRRTPNDSNTIHMKLMHDPSTWDMEENYPTPISPAGAASPNLSTPFALDHLPALLMGDPQTPPTYEPVNQTHSRSESSNTDHEHAV